MGDNNGFFALYGKSALYQLFASLMIVMVVGTLLFCGFFLAGKLIFDIDLSPLEDPSSAVGENSIGFLKYVLIAQHISFFIVPSLILIIKLKPGKLTGLADMKTPPLNETALVILLAFCTFPVTGFAGELNAGIHFPDWLSGVEQWMIKNEEGANRLAKIIMDQENFGAMLLNLFMIAFLPAIGEELLFRGVLQKIFYTLFKSGHLAIWVTAFIFSALHFQFFGFLPRFILGLIFGYLFYWSGTLWLPVISHFVNNAVSVIAAYLQGWDKVSGLPDISFWKQIIRLAFPALICVLILLYFRNKSLRESSDRIIKSGLQNKDY